MEQFIGTKIVDAEVDNSEVAPGEALPGYRVKEQDGMVTWWPKEDFEQAFRPADGMSFGLAIEAAKMGKRIARKGWNGKNQYVELGTDFQYTCAASDIPGSVGVQHTDIGSKALVFVGTRGSQVGWLASQADMLADDWYIVE